MNEDERRLLDLEDAGTRTVQIAGDTYERLRDNRWRRADGRIVLILDLEDSDAGELPWRIMVDGEYVLGTRRDTGETGIRRFAHPWHAVQAARRIIAGRTVQ